MRVSSLYTLEDHIIRIIIASAIIVLLLTLRLAQLQIHLAAIFTKKSEQNCLRTEEIPSLRGNIVSCDGTLLATNRPVINLYWQGTGSRNLQDHDTEILIILEQILGKEITANPDLMNKINQAQRHYKQIVLATDISFQELSKIVEQFPNHENIVLVTNFKRFYPHKASASHLLGYLTTINTTESMGKMGLEKVLEETLRGQHGTRIKKINSLGRSLAETELYKSLQGQTITTTIDIEMQNIIERVFPENNAGTCIIMDPYDGSIRALLSRPNFDPTIFLQPLSHEDWQKLQEKNPFLNRALNACYPPGSIFKLITISAALEHNIVLPDSVWYCNGYYSFGGRNYGCHQHQGHGHLKTQQAVAHSCNILFFEIGKQVSINLLADYAHRFGLGKTTNSIFPEKPGLVPTTEWKRTVLKERWWPGETLSAAIGQSFLLVTPLQIARMISSIFTGYLVKPRILMSELVETEPLEIKNSTLKFLKESMRQVVTMGTGRTANTTDMEIYAKTSTAQTSDLSKRNLGQLYLEHGWFVAHVKYKNQQPFVLVLLIEHAGSSQVPTAVAKQFLLEYKKMIKSKILI